MKNPPSLYNDPLERAHFDEYGPVEKVNLWQLQGDQELVVRPEEIYGWASEVHRAELEAWHDADHRAAIAARKVLDEKYGLRIPGGIVWAREITGPNQARYYQATHKVHGIYFSTEKLRNQIDNKYHLEAIPLDITRRAFDSILHYYEDVVKGEVKGYISDLRLGNLIYGRLLDDDYDDIYAFDIEQYNYHPANHPLENIRKNVIYNLWTDLAEMKAAYNDNFSEFEERLRNLSSNFDLVRSHESRLVS